MADFSNATWRKSTHSANNGCLEVAFVDSQVAIRDSKDRKGPMLVFSAAEWQAFLAGARESQFELPG
jgi:Domain of unknown function (DUF397)